jgi:hypothetical protein
MPIHNEFNKMSEQIFIKFLKVILKNIIILSTFIGFPYTCIYITFVDKTAVLAFMMNVLFVIVHLYKEYFKETFNFCLFLSLPKMMSLNSWALVPDIPLFADRKWGEYPRKNRVETWTWVYRGILHTLLKLTRDKGQAYRTQCHLFSERVRERVRVRVYVRAPACVSEFQILKWSSCFQGTIPGPNNVRLYSHMVRSTFVWAPY